LEKLGYVQVMLSTIQCGMVHVLISKLKLFLSYCVGVKFGILHEEQNTDREFVKAGCEENV
jgi:hypothetical protein